MYRDERKVSALSLGRSICCRVRCTHVRQGLIEQKEVTMIWTIAVILIILWVLGLVSSYTMGGFIHVLLVIAIIVVLFNIIQGRRPLG
jgi:hypothetical protein